VQRQVGDPQPHRELMPVGHSITPLAFATVTTASRCAGSDRSIVREPARDTTPIRPRQFDTTPY
jgi:hypothetical protein